MHCFCTYYGAEHFASNFDFALWRKDLPKFNLFAPHPQKRLDNSSATTYNGARYPKKNSRRTTTGAPAPKISRSQAFFQEIFGDCVPRGTSESWHDFCLRKMFSKNNIKRLPKLLNQSQ